jgi:hypothetical protein
MARDDDDDDEFHRQETIVEKSDRMAREVSARREIRLREERVRLLADGPTKKKRSRSRPNPQAPVIHTETIPVSPPESPEPRDTDPERGPRLSDPFPPLQRPGSKPRPAPAQQQQQQRQPRPAPAPAPFRAPSQMDVLAVELEELLRGFRAGWRKARGADKAALVSAMMTLAGVMAPWISDPAHPLQLGITSGGVFHAALGIASALIVTRTAPSFDQGRTSARDRERRYRRGGIWLVLLGASSTMLCVFLLVYWSLSKGADWPIDIHPGFYWTLAWGTGVSYGGYARFGAPSSMD